MSLDIQSGLQYDEGFGQRALSPATWKSYNRLGLTKFPYGFDTAYPSTVSRLILDAQAVMTQYPRFGACLGDTGRCIRFQFKDAGTPIDLDGYTITIDSWNASTAVAIRTAYDISAMVTEGANGFLEWVLGATDTAASFYYTVSLAKVGYAFKFPTTGYLYCDIEDKTSFSAYDTTMLRPHLKLKASPEGGVLEYAVKSADGVALNLLHTGTCKMYAKTTGHAVTRTVTLKYVDGILRQPLASGDFAYAGTWFCYFELTGRTGAVVYLPTRGHFIVEVQ